MHQVARSTSRTSSRRAQASIVPVPVAPALPAAATNSLKTNGVQTAPASTAPSNSSQFRFADSFWTVADDTINEMLGRMHLQNERELLLRLRLEQGEKKPAPVIEVECREKPEELIHAELCEMCRARMVRDLISSTNMKFASEEARAKVLAMCKRESTKMGSLRARVHWAVRGLPAALCERLPRQTLEGGVPRIEAPSAQRLYDEFVSKNLPCIITGTLDTSSFPPLKTFRDDAYLRQRCGHRRVPVKGHFLDESNGARRIFFNDEDRRVTLAQYLDAAQAAAASGTPLSMYLAKVPLRKHLPELSADIRDARASPGAAYGSCFGKPLEDGVIMYFGGGANTTNTHFDAYENLMLVIDGTKKLLLFPPGEADHLYVTRMGGVDYSYSAIPPMVKPSDEYEPHTFPRFAKARCVEVELHAGDILYLPIFWWHGVSGTGRNCILNWWFDMNSRKKDANARNDRR